jgi:hypothetical protein
MFSIVCSANYLYLARVHIPMLHEGHQETLGPSFSLQDAFAFSPILKMTTVGDAPQTGQPLRPAKLNRDSALAAFLAA